MDDVAQMTCQYLILVTKTVAKLFYCHVYIMVGQLLYRKYLQSGANILKSYILLKLPQAWEHSVK